MGIAFKCVRCETFFGKPSLDERSFIDIHNKKTGSLVTYDLCDPCFENIYVHLLSLIHTIPEPSKELIVEGEILEEPTQEVAETPISQEVSETPSEDKIQVAEEKGEVNETTAGV